MNVCPLESPVLCGFEDPFPNGTGARSFLIMQVAMWVIVKIDDSPCQFGVAFGAAACSLCFWFKRAGGLSKVVQESVANAAGLVIDEVVPEMR